MILSYRASVYEYIRATSVLLGEFVTWLLSQEIGGWVREGKGQSNILIGYFYRTLHELYPHHQIFLDRLGTPLCSHRA